LRFLRQALISSSSSPCSTYLVRDVARFAGDWSAAQTSFSSARECAASFSLRASALLGPFGLEHVACDLQQLVMIDAQQSAHILAVHPGRLEQNLDVIDQRHSELLLGEFATWAWRPWRRSRRPGRSPSRPFRRSSTVLHAESDTAVKQSNNECGLHESSIGRVVAAKVASLADADCVPGSIARKINELHSNNAMCKT
jgi:hypothetical protein